VLKIRSPLTFGAQHADVLLEVLEQTLKEVD
jgi:4-aminobutyrate aminotransferase-like enzyme